MDNDRMKPRVIGLTGYKRAGKDSVAGFLKAYRYKPLALAEPVKQTALAIDPWVLTHFQGGVETLRLSWIVEERGWEDAKENPEVRRLLQQIGTEGGREIHGDNVWLNLAERRMKPEVAYAEPDRWAIADVRFVNEAEWVWDLGGVVWKIARPGGSADGHASETGVDHIQEDLLIRNDGTLMDLRDTVDKLMLPPQREGIPTISFDGPPDNDSVSAAKVLVGAGGNGFGAS